MKINNHDDRLKELGISSKKKSSSDSVDKTREDDKKKSFVESSFEGVFLDHSSKLNDNQINTLVQDIDIAGNKLKKTGKMSDFYIYRNLLKSLFSKIIPQTYHVQKSYSKPSLMKPISKEFHLISTIDKSMDSLLKMINVSQKDHIKIASKVVEIKGLIVNLVK